jgi:hypothetical protein
LDPLHLDSLARETGAERRRQAGQAGRVFGPTPFGLADEGEGCGEEAAGGSSRAGVWTHSIWTIPVGFWAWMGLLQLGSTIHLCNTNIL